MSESDIITYHLKGIGEVKLNPKTGKMFCDTSIDSKTFNKRFDNIIQENGVPWLGAQMRDGFDFPRKWHKYGKNYTVFLKKIFPIIVQLLEKEG